MLHIDNLEELFDIITDAILDEESVSFISNEEGVRSMMRLICANTEIVPDLIQFDSESEGYYYISIDKSDFDGVSFSVTSALLDDGNFYGLQGLVFVDDIVPSKYDRCIENNKYITSDPIRISYEPEEYEDEDDCDGNCERCPYHDYPKIDYDKNGRISGFNHSWKDGNNSYSYSFHSSNEKDVLDIINELF